MSGHFLSNLWDNWIMFPMDEKVPDQNVACLNCSIRIFLTKVGKSKREMTLKKDNLTRKQPKRKNATEKEDLTSLISNLSWIQPQRYRISHEDYFTENKERTQYLLLYVWCLYVSLLLSFIIILQSPKNTPTYHQRKTFNPSSEHNFGIWTFLTHISKNYGHLTITHVTFQSICNIYGSKMLMHKLKIYSL